MTAGHGARVPAGSPDAVLNDPVGASLAGVHAHLARRIGRVATYPPEFATFTALPAQPTSDDWADLARLLGPGELADLFTSSATPPPDWKPVFNNAGHQLVAPTAPPPGPRVASGEPPVVELHLADVAEMLALAGSARPGPFYARTAELGLFLGVRESGRLVAMAGQRLRPSGWTEISAVCTAPDARGRGHAARLVAGLTARIAARGERAFLHVVDGNPAVHVYRRLGFTTRRTVQFRGFRVPPSH